ncbi:MAG TPA: methyltransferase domain-containing protein [Terriglobales bacterium]|nr:methyltransferase domain-containing protein [Terriglobales bacterium]
MASESASWGSAFRVAASQKWRRQSAAMGAGVTQAILQLAAARPGMQVLDLACGTGEPAISLASQVGQQGRVIGIDINAELLEVARDRAQQRSLSNIEFRQADAHALPFASDSFDLVTSRFGVMFFEDVVRALGEAHRILRPRGRIALLAWGPFEQPYFLSTIAIVGAHVTNSTLQPGTLNMFRFSQPGSMTAALKQAGFTRIEERTVTVPWSWPGPPEQVWEYFREITVPFRPLLSSIPPDKGEQVNAEINAAVRRHYDGKQVNFTADVVLASGEK